jgi:hypothetical protein
VLKTPIRGWLLPGSFGPKRAPLPVFGVSTWRVRRTSARVERYRSSGKITSRAPEVFINTSCAPGSGINGRTTSGQTLFAASGPGPK